VQRESCIPGSIVERIRVGAGNSILCFLSLVGVSLFSPREPVVDVILVGSLLDGA
jgi:hypothetical protein